MKLDALDHPKTLDFSARLGVSRPTAIGHLELLWAFAGKQSAQGNVGKWPDGAIARACDWMGEPEAFIGALVGSGFLDRDSEHRLTVHDWSDHAPGWVRAKLKKLDLDFITSEHSSEPSSEGSSEPSRDGLEHSSEASNLTSEPSSRAPVPSEVKCREEKGREGKNGTMSALPTDVTGVFEHWKREHGHPKSQLDEKRLKLIRVALKSYTPEQLCQSISGYKNSPHHMGQNDRRTVYDDIELFLRDAKHIDAGLKFAEQGPPEKWQ